MTRPGVARRFGRIAMGTDVDRVFRAMDVIGEMADNSVILDVPCGGGIGILRLREERRTRYVGVDISPAMLRRASHRLPAPYSDRVRLVQASIENLPFADGKFDLCVCFNGLHCVPDPAAAVAEMRRCLRPGGRLIGELAVRGQVARADAYMALLRVSGAFGPAGTRADIQRWCEGAGLVIDSLACSGAIAHFDAHRAD